MSAQRVFKGFVTNSGFFNNMPSVVSRIGEISDISLTYARDKKVYTNSDNAQISVYEFAAKDQNGTISITSEEQASINKVARFIYDYINKFSSRVNSDEITVAFNKEFETTCSNAIVGPVIKDGTYSIPTSIDFTTTVNNQDTHVKLWFTDKEFQFEYDEFEIIVVPPIDTLDNFFGGESLVKDLMGKETIVSQINRTQKARGVYRETEMVVVPYNYHSPVNSDLVSVNIYVLVHGIAGNNNDAITDAIVNYFLNNSTHTREQWKTVFPELFRRTEFTFIPMWDQYAIANRTVEAGLYSPVLNIRRIKDLFFNKVPAYDQGHVNLYMEVLSHPYKSLQIAVSSNPENLNNWFQITDLFPDYLNVSSTSLDFNRMKSATRNWSEMLYSLIILAETYDVGTTLPQGVSRVIRNNVVYLGKSINYVHYYVATRSNFTVVNTGV